MSLSIKQIRENCKAARAAMERARADHFAVGAFNIDNQETLVAIARAAQKLQAPVMVEISHGEAEAMGIDNVRDLVDNYKAQYGIEMYVNGDHIPTVELAYEMIEAGFEFIHIDVSQANHNAKDKEIIAATKQVVDYAKLTGAIVESEPHYFQGSSNVHTETIDYAEIKKTFTRPLEAKKFSAATGIDTFAAAVGNLHGKYPVPKIIDLDLLERVRRALPNHVNISLHGGSGTPLHFFEEAVRIGVTKINVNSDMRYAFRTTVEKVLRENPDEFALVKLMDEVKDAVQEVVESKLKHYNATGKAYVG